MKPTLLYYNICLFLCFLAIAFILCSMVSLHFKKKDKIIKDNYFIGPIQITDEDIARLQETKKRLELVKSEKYSLLTEIEKDKLDDSINEYDQLIKLWIWRKESIKKS